MCSGVSDHKKSNPRREIIRERQKIKKGQESRRCVNRKSGRGRGFPEDRP